MRTIRLLYSSFIGLFLLIGCTVPTWAQQEGFLTLEKDSITIGDQIQLKLSVRLNKKYTDVQFPTVPDTFNNIEIISRGTVDSISNKDYNLFEQQLLITSFEEGNYTIPSWNILFIDSTNNPRSVALPTTDLYVRTIAIDTTKTFMPIVEIEEEPAPDLLTQISSFISEHKDLLIGIGIGLLFLILAIVAYILWKRKKNKVVKPKELPFLKAQRLVQELESSKIWEQGQYKEYYSALSEIVKVYFDEQLSINATEMTTRDLLLLVKKSANFRGIHGELRQILQIADLTKFAKGIPTDEDHIESVKNAFRIIEHTRPTVEANDNDQ